MPVDTLGSLRTDILDWLADSVPDARVDAAANDAIESLWGTMINTCVSTMIGGPVSLTIGSGVEGVILVSIADPTDAPVVSSIAAADPTLSAHTVDTAYSYVTDSGTETKISPVTTYLTSTGFLAAVHPPALVSNALGWNCYARTFATGALVKQNDEPLDFLSNGGQPFAEPESGFISDPGLPQPPFENSTGDDICYIRHLEAQMPDLGYKAYDAADIDSLAMRHASRNVASASEFQTYYWDLINQRQLEIRPATGTAWTPRYFYVKRPRRLRFDNSPLPFPSIPSTGFLRYYALSLLSITIREYEQAAAWERKAEAERMRCALVIVDMNRPKNQYITPYP